MIIVTLKDMNITNDMPYGWVRGVTQPLWHKRVYKMWTHMWCRIYINPSNKDYEYYKNSKGYEPFRYLSNYVEWIMQEPRFEEFCNTCENIKWCIDKDGKCLGNKCYYPQYMTLTTFVENSRESLERNGNPFIYNNPAKKQRRPIIGVGMNSIIVFESIMDAEHYGVCKSRSKLIDCLKGRTRMYKKYKWYYLDIQLL